MSDFLIGLVTVAVCVGIILVACRIADKIEEITAAQREQDRKYRGGHSDD